jgi:methionyl-tRNA synthetase
LTADDRALLESSRAAFATVGADLGRCRFKSSITSAMHTIGEANKYFSDQAPWKLKTSDPERMATVLHVALQVVDDAKTLLTPFLPNSSQKVYDMLHPSGGVWADMPRIEHVDEDGGPSYPVITGQYDETPRWSSVPITPGTPLAKPTPLFKKIDPSVADEEIARLGG